MKKAILFGRGNYKEQKLKDIEKHYSVIGYIDNAIKPGTTERIGKLWVRNPVELSFFDEDAVIILLSFKWYEMYVQLIERNIDEKRIRFGIMFNPAMDVVEQIINENITSIYSENGMICLEALGEKYVCKNEDDFKKWMRSLFAKNTPFIDVISSLPINPVSKRFGIELGTAVDRVYIEKFIDSKKDCICGTVMEIAEPKYAKKYQDKINEMQILHINGWGDHVIKGDFATGEGIIEKSVDCLICTQTLLCIYDLPNTVKNIYKLLREGGTALVTVPGITQISLYDYRNWGQYWSFTEKSIRRLFEEHFEKDKIEVVVYGNAKTALGFIYGISAEFFGEKDFAYDDEQFQVIIGVKAKR